MLALDQIAILLAIGLVAGCVGTFVGLGGGFIIVPLLLLVFKLEPAAVVATSMFVILCNSITGSFFSARQRRIDWKAGFVVSAGSVPAVIAGTLVVEHLDAGAFSLVIGVVLVFAAIMLAIQRRIRKDATGLLKGGERRSRTLRNGVNFRYHVNMPLLCAFGVVKGFFAGMTGIAGGSLLGPFFILVMGIPVTVATATTQFSIVFTSASGTAFNVFGGRIAFEYAIPMSVGVVAGALVGSRFAGKVRSDVVRWVLTIILLAVALKMLLH